MMMAIVKALAFLAWSALLAGVSLAEEKELPKPANVPDYSYCTAYVLSDEKAHAGVLRETGEVPLDLPQLAALKTQEARLTPEQAKRVIAATGSDAERLPPAECYEPHHVFVFHAQDATPVACLEVCFTCNAAKMNPSADPANANLYDYDQNALAKMFVELKLPLTPFASLEEYEKDKAAEKEQFEKTMKELAARQDDPFAGFSYSTKLFLNRGPAPVPGATPAETVGALYSNQVFFEFREATPPMVTDYLAACLTPGLKEALDAQYAEIGRRQEQNPDAGAKPPIIEGGIFIGNYEGATRYKVGKSQAEGDRAKVTVDLELDREGEKISSTATPLLVKSGERWLLDDIDFGGGETLRKSISFDK